MAKGKIIHQGIHIFGKHFPEAIMVPAGQGVISYSKGKTSTGEPVITISLLPEELNLKPGQDLTVEEKNKQEALFAIRFTTKDSIKYLRDYINEILDHYEQGS